MEPPAPGLPTRNTLVGRALGYTKGSVLARFATVGIVNTLVDLIIYVALTFFGAGPIPANFISTSAGMTVSFAGNRRYVFGGTGNRLREIMLFALVCGLGIWVIQPIVIIGTSELLDHTVSLPILMHSTIPKIIAILVAAAWNYFLYARLVFRPRSPIAKGIEEGDDNQRRN